MEPQRLAAMTAKFVSGMFSKGVVYRHMKVSVLRYTVLPLTPRDSLLGLKTVKYGFGIARSGACFLDGDSKRFWTTITTTEDMSSTLLASLNNGVGVPAQIRTCSDTLISTGKNGALTFWNKSWLGEDRTVLAHASIIVALYITDTHLFTGRMDGLIKKWDLQSGQLIQEIPSRFKDLRVIVIGQERLIAVCTDDANTALEVSDKCFGAQGSRFGVITQSSLYTTLC